MLEISVINLRQKLIDKIINNTVHELLPTSLHKINARFPLSANDRALLPNDKPTLLNYHYLLRLSEVIGILNYKDLRYNSDAAISLNKGISESTNLTTEMTGLLPLVATVAYKDMAKVNAFICAVAWLSIDDFKWHTQYPSYLVPEDLSYGLVLQYPDFIIPFCSVIADYKREECYSKIQEESLKLVSKYAHEDLKLYG